MSSVPLLPTPKKRRPRRRRKQLPEGVIRRGPCPHCRNPCKCYDIQGYVEDQGLTHLPKLPVELVCCTCSPIDTGWQCLYTGHAIEHANPTDAEAADLIACRLGVCDHTEFVQSYGYRSEPWDNHIPGGPRYRIRIR